MMKQLMTEEQLDDESTQRIALFQCGELGFHVNGRRIKTARFHRMGK